MSSSPSPDSSRARFTQGERLARRDASAGLRAALASSSLFFSRDDSRSHSIRWHSTCRSRTSSEVAAGFDEASAADDFRLTEGRSSSSAHPRWSSSRSCFAPRALVLARTARSYLAARVDAPPRCARFFLAPTHANMLTAPRASAARHPPFVTPGAAWPDLGWPNPREVIFSRARNDQLMTKNFVVKTFSRRHVCSCFGRRGTAHRAPREMER